MHRPQRRPFARLLPVLACVTLAVPSSATWSIVVANRATGEVGLAAATCLIATNLKSGLTCVIAGKGAGANQYAGVASNIVAMGQGFRQDLSPEEILELVLVNEPFNAQLQTGMDTHFATWATVQPQKIEQGNQALAALLNDLREDDPMMECTTVVAYSEFARTPRINGNSGRDHWFASSILVFGGGLRRGVVGGTAGVGGIRFDFGSLNGFERGTTDANAALQAATNPDAGWSESPPF